MKKFAVSLCCLVLLFAFAAPAYAEADNEESFTQLVLDAEDDLLYWDSSRTIARYADDKTPIALSMYYDDEVHITIPTANLSREIEVFMADPVEFTDLEEYSYEYFVMEDVSLHGVMEGFEGRARINDPVRRCEAVAIILRTVGLDSLEPTVDPGFKDVAADDWYAKDVALAYEWGIVTGDSAEKFSPDRNVSRQEFVAMAARALTATGMHYMQDNVNAAQVGKSCYIEDADKIYQYALPAYELLGRFAITTEVETGNFDAEGVPEPDFYAEPTKAATRFECAQVADNIITHLHVFPYQIAVELGFDQEMPVIDGSTSSYPMTDALYGMLFYNGYNHPDKPASHSKSHASYEKLIKGEVDFLFAAVAPSAEIEAMAEKAGVKLEMVPIAADAMVFFTNAENPINGITTKQLQEIYVNDAYDNWLDIGGSDAKLIPYCRNTDSGSHSLMETYILDGKQINANIAKETTSITMANILTDVMDVPYEDPDAFGLGYTLYYYYQNMDLFYDSAVRLKLLAIDGIAPNDETIKDLSYPLMNNTYAVIRADEPADSPARILQEFMITPLGQVCVGNSGFAPMYEIQ